MWWALQHKVRKFWYEQIISRIKPRQKWLTDKLGRTWIDKDTVIETAIFESMIHFWEDEKGEEMQRFQFECIESPCRSAAAKPEDQERYAEQRRIYSELDKCYRYARMRDQVWEEFYNTPIQGRNGWQKEQAIIDKETEILVKIVQLRKYLWT